MKKRILNQVKVTMFIVILAGLSFSIGTNPQEDLSDTNLFALGLEAQAVCQEYTGTCHVCCFYGGTGCVNGVTDEYDGPYYIGCW